MHLFRNWAKDLVFLLIYMMSGLVLVLIIDGLLSGTDLTPLNSTVEQFISNFRTPFMTNLMIFVTYIGSPFVLFSVACFLSFFLILHKDSYNAMIFILSIMLSVISFVVLKESFQVSRPDGGTLDFIGWSFPSGHATVATAFFFSLAHSFFNYSRKLWAKLFVTWGSIFAIFVISLSRLYLGAHLTLDILGGIALGLLSVSFVVLFFSIFLGERGLRRRR
jgi:membrane-associated phospholipid phosphatase